MEESPFFFPGVQSSKVRGLKTAFERPVHTILNDVLTSGTTGSQQGHFKWCKIAGWKGYDDRMIGSFRASVIDWL